MTRLSNAQLTKRIHGWATLQWLGHLPVVVVLYFWFPGFWESVSILYLALVSIYANVVGHWGAWQAARAEVKADHD